jgi:hypothetical protein
MPAAYELTGIHLAYLGDIQPARQYFCEWADSKGQGERYECLFYVSKTDP